MKLSADPLKPHNHKTDYSMRAQSFQNWKRSIKSINNFSVFFVLFFSSSSYFSVFERKSHARALTHNSTLYTYFGWTFGPRETEKKQQQKWLRILIRCYFTFRFIFLHCRILKLRAKSKSISKFFVKQIEIDIYLAQCVRCLRFEWVRKCKTGANNCRCWIQFEWPC